jgi:hypothetical protein
MSSSDGTGQIQCTYDSTNANFRSNLPAPRKIVREYLLVLWTRPKCVRDGTHQLDDVSSGPSVDFENLFWLTAPSHFFQHGPKELDSGLGFLVQVLSELRTLLPQAKPSDIVRSGAGQRGSLGQER